jgi:flagellar biosynthesis protein FlhA
VVEDVVPGTISLGELVRVVRLMLKEGLSIRDFRSILEGVGDAAPRSKDTGFLVEQVRRRLARQITSRVADAKGVVHALTLDRNTEELLRKSLGQSEGEATLAPDVATAKRFISNLEAHAANFAATGRPTTLVTSPDLAPPHLRLRLALHSRPVGRDRARAGVGHAGRARRHHRFESDVLDQGRLMPITLNGEDE